MSERRAMPAECPAPCETPEDCVEEGGCLLGYAVEGLKFESAPMVPRGPWTIYPCCECDELVVWIGPLGEPGRTWACKNGHLFSMAEMVEHECVVVPRSEAEALADALESAATRPDPYWPSDVRAALDAYRAAYPREETP